MIELARAPRLSAIAACLLGAAACSAAGGTGTGPQGSGGHGGGASSAHAGSAHGGGGHGGGPTLAVGSGGGGGACSVHCSADLHQVLDCTGAVVTTCPASQGCGPAGTCTDPCASAELNASTVGCEFYSVLPAPENETRGSCFAVLLANTWDSPVGIQVDYGGQPLAVAGLARSPVGSGASLSYVPLANGELAAGQIAVLFLAQGPGGVMYHLPCPAGVTPGIAVDASIPGTGLGTAFHVTTTAPVVAYDMYPYGGAASHVSSATLLVPTSAWGTNYIAADGYQEDPLIAGDGGRPFVQVVARADATHVTLSPTAALSGGPGVAPSGQGQPVTYTLAKGQVLQLQEDSELAGTPISADQPISVWGGSGCMNIPVGKYACDSAHQELLPVKALGRRYVGARYRDRVPGQAEVVPWTLVGAVDGTALVYDPAPPAGAPLALSSGQMVRFSASDPFSVTSQDDQHPFYMAGHMTGWMSLASDPGNQGDPEYVTVIPPEQYLSYYLFLTDPTYGNTNLVFVRQQAPDGTFKEVSLDCAGQVTGWQAVGAAGKFEVARVDLVVGGAPQGACGNGVHTAKSDAPFGLTVWGWDSSVSYAYPAGMSTQPINTVVVPPIPK